MLDLASNDSVHLSVTKPSPVEPNTFTLSRPAVPDAKSVVELTATATVQSGGTQVSLKTNVTFGSEICGVMTEFPLMHSPSLEDITVGPDGALWFTENQRGYVGRITTAGAKSEHILVPANSGPEGITVGSDGALWIAEPKASAIGRITTLNVDDFVTPSRGAPGQVTLGPDQNVWFTEGDRIGRITPAGDIKEFPLEQFVVADNIVSEQHSVVPRPDKGLWFTEYVRGVFKIGRINVSGVVTNEIAILNSGGRNRGPHKQRRRVTVVHDSFVDCRAARAIDKSADSRVVRSH